MKGKPATILTVWERLSDVVARTGAGVAMGDVDFDTSTGPLRNRRVSGPRKAPNSRVAPA